MEHTSDSAVLSSSSMRRTKAAQCAIVAAFLALFLPSMAKHTNAIVFTYMGVVSLCIVLLLFGVVRSFRAGIYLSGDGVVVRTTFSTKSWRFAELERAESIDLVSRGGPVGLGAMATAISGPRIQIIPVFRLVDRGPVVVRALRTSTGSVDEPSWLDEALQEINRRIEGYRHSHGPA